MDRPVHIQLGRNGDLIMLMPCWLKLFQATGQKPIVLVSREFAELFEGVSYVEPDIINGHWYASVALAAQMAGLKYPSFTVTQCHGVGHSTDQPRYETFGHAMWSKAGFPGYGGLPLVFDRRDAGRERELVAHYKKSKPLLLYNFAGLSSPLPASLEIHQRLSRYVGRFDLIDLGRIKAARLYDLLGLYDAAAGLITIDTATLHLAAASGIPMLAYCRGGWSSAIPKPGAMRVDYPEAHRRLDAVDTFMQSLLPVC